MERHAIHRRSAESIWHRREGGRDRHGQDVSRRTGRHAGDSREGTLRREGKTIRRNDDALARTAYHPGYRGHAVERPPAHTRSFEGRNRPAWLRAKGSAGRIQEGSIHFI